MCGLYTFTHMHTYTHTWGHMHACMGPRCGLCMLSGMQSNELVEEACPPYLMQPSELQTATALSTH